MTKNSILWRIDSMRVSLMIRSRALVRWHKRKTVGVVILAKSDSKQSIRMTQMCINTVIKLNSSNCRVVVVESGSYNEYANAKVLVPDFDFAYNLFLCAGIRFLDQWCCPDYYLILNNDVAVLPSSIDELVNADVLSASPIDPTGSEQSGIRRPTRGYSVRYHVLGWALFLKAELVEKFGSEVLFPNDIKFYWQDHYYAEVIKHHGVKHFVIPSSQMLHLESATTTKEVHIQMENNGDYEAYVLNMNRLKKV